MGKLGLGCSLVGVSTGTDHESQRRKYGRDELSSSSHHVHGQVRDRINVLQCRHPVRVPLDARHVVGGLLFMPGMHGRQILRAGDRALRPGVALALAGRPSTMAATVTTSG